MTNFRRLCDFSLKNFYTDLNNYRTLKKSLFEGKGIDEDYCLISFNQSKYTIGIEDKTYLNQLEDSEINNINYLMILHKDLEFENYLLNTKSKMFYLVYDKNKILPKNNGRIFDSFTQADKMLDYKMKLVDTKVMEKLEEKLINTIL